MFRCKDRRPAAPTRTGALLVSLLGLMAMALPAAAQQASDEGDLPFVERTGRAPTLGYFAEAKKIAGMDDRPVLLPFLVRSQRAPGFMGEAKRNHKIE